MINVACSPTAGRVCAVGRGLAVRNQAGKQQQVQQAVHAVHAEHPSLFTGPWVARLRPAVDRRGSWA